MIVGLVATAVSLYYYLAVIRALYMRPAAELQFAAGGSPPRDALLQVGVIACVAITIGSFFAVQPLIDLATKAVSSLSSYGRGDFGSAPGVLPRRSRSASAPASTPAGPAPRTRRRHATTAEIAALRNRPLGAERRAHGSGGEDEQQRDDVQPGDRAPVGQHVVARRAPRGPPAPRRRSRGSRRGGGRTRASDAGGVEDG